jgi:predicted nucleotide-binding protein (sugar kinase/HSP70/actin superfamily)
MEEERMKVTFPHMGNINIPLKAFFTALGVEVIEPPPITQKTISLGTRYAPELPVCRLKSMWAITWKLLI